MHNKIYSYSKQEVECIFDCNVFELVDDLQKRKEVFIVTDESLFNCYSSFFSKHKTYVVGIGESAKQQSTVDKAIEFLLNNQASKQSYLIGIGGGVVTDLTGYIASVFKRGMNLILAPSSVLAMVDAAIGGKNGVNVGQLKNMVGTTYQPIQIWFDYQILKTLPRKEWINGFAEIIKHAAIADKNLFEELQQKNIDFYIQEKKSLADLIEKNVEIKTNITVKDEFEQQDRKLLNFGHTVGHAIENKYGIDHGNAVAIGMVFAAKMSELLGSFPEKETEELQQLIEKYELPTAIKTDIDSIWDAIIMDKKREADSIKFVLLHQIGEGYFLSLDLDSLKDKITQVIAN